MKKLITQDVYDIVKQIKQIDKNYFVMFDEEKKKYELHDHRNKPSLSITLYDKLDKRSIKKGILRLIKLKHSIVSRIFHRKSPETKEYSLLDIIQPTSSFKEVNVPPVKKK